VSSRTAFKSALEWSPSRHLETPHSVTGAHRAFWEVVEVSMKSNFTSCAPAWNPALALSHSDNPSCFYSPRFQKAQIYTKGQITACNFVAILSLQSRLLLLSSRSASLGGLAACSALGNYTARPLGLLPCALHSEHAFQSSSVRKARDIQLISYTVP